MKKENIVPFKNTGKLINAWEAIPKSEAKSALNRAVKQEKQRKQEKTDMKKANSSPKASLKTRFWSGVLYPESLPSDWFEKLKSLGYAGAYIKHYADLQLHSYAVEQNGKEVERPGLADLLTKYKKLAERKPVSSPDENFFDKLDAFKIWLENLPEGLPDWREIELFADWVEKCLNKKYGENVRIMKKTHIHFILVTDKRLTAKNLVKRLKTLLGKDAISFKTLQPIKTSVKQVWDYFMHQSLEAKAEHKHVYSENEIVCFNGFDIRDFISYSPEQKKYCLTLFGNLSIITQKMAQIYGQDHLKLTTLYRAQLVMASPEAVKLFLTDWAIPSLEYFADKKVDTRMAFKDYFQDYLNQEEAKATLKMADFVLNSLAIRHDWPAQELFLQSYISYRNFYRDYMRVNEEK